MRYKCRCNKRACEARRTFAKHPDEYKHGRPKCHIPGCEGIMYALKNQTASERGGWTCPLQCLPYPHSVRDKRCEQHEDYVLTVAGNKKAGNKTEPDWSLKL